MNCTEEFLSKANQSMIDSNAVSSLLMRDIKANIDICAIVKNDDTVRAKLQCTLADKDNNFGEFVNLLRSKIDVCENVLLQYIANISGIIIACQNYKGSSDDFFAKVQTKVDDTPVKIDWGKITVQSLLNVRSKYNDNVTKHDKSIGCDGGNDV